MRNLQSVAGEYGLYEHGVTIVKEMGDSVKVVQLRSVRKKGLENGKVERKTQKKKIGYEKLEAATSRAKRMVKEYALCNEWDYFVTFTIEKEKFDRYDLKAYYKAFGEFIHNYNRRCTEDEKVRYILIPEMHEDGAWHMHGLVNGIRGRDLVKNEHGYLVWKQYTEKFGRIMSLGKIRDKNKVSSYITKYISKNMARSVSEYGAHLYYCSRGLKTGTVIYRGTEKVTVTSGWDFERADGFCKVKWYDSVDAFSTDVSFGLTGVVVDDDGSLSPDYFSIAML